MDLVSNKEKGIGASRRLLRMGTGSQNGIAAPENGTTKSVVRSQTGEHRRPFGARKKDWKTGGAMGNREIGVGGENHFLVADLVGQAKTKFGDASP